MIEAAQLAELIDSHVRGYVDKALDEIEKRFAEDDEMLRSLQVAADALPAAIIKELPPGPKGEDATEEQIAEAVRRYFAEHPIEKPKDGDNATDEQVSSAVEAYFAANPVPAPKDGKNATDKQVAKAVADYLIANPPEPGEPGKDAAIEQIADAVEQYMAAHPATGDPGKDASDEQVAAAVEKYLKAHPPMDGENGKSVAVEDVLPILQEELQKAIEAIPLPKDGEPGKDGRDGIDGKSVTLDDINPLLEAMQSAWALDFERRAQALFQSTIDKMPLPKDGKDGIDGFGFDDFTMTFDGRRTLVWKFEKGDQVKALEFKIPVVLDSGIWKEGNFYEQGDGVTFGGSFWLAQRNTDDKPGTSDAWRLAVKKGRDGK